MDKSVIIARFFDQSGRLTITNKAYIKHVALLLDWMLRADKARDDVSTKAILGIRPISGVVTANVVPKESGVLAGLEEARCFLTNQTTIQIYTKLRDGRYVKSGSQICTLKGNFADIVAHERVILNVLQRMSGIATETSRLIKKAHLAPLYKNRPYLAATRKTPWMWLDKKAVAVGGGLTHRLSLSDGILVKDNHLHLLLNSKGKNGFDRLMTFLGSVSANEPFEMEVGSPKEAKIVIAAYIESRCPAPLVLMLDNFSVRDASTTVREINKVSNKFKRPVVIELSGGINESNIRAYADSGADVLSMGTLTDSATSLDLSLRIDE